MASKLNHFQGPKRQLSPLDTKPKNQLTFTQNRVARPFETVDKDSFLMQESNQDSQLSMIHEIQSSMSKSPLERPKQIKFLNQPHSGIRSEQRKRESEQGEDTQSLLDKINGMVSGQAREEAVGLNMGKSKRPLNQPNYSRQSATLKLLNDREKFILAKNHSQIDTLLELIQSNDNLRSNSFIDVGRNSAQAKVFQHQKTNNLKLTQVSNLTSNHHLSSGHYSKDTSTITQSNPNTEFRSDLKREWMQHESLISHSAINQLSYLILQKKKEIKLHAYYNTDTYKHKIMEMLSLRKSIISNFEQLKTIEKRIQRYLLMADDAGIQSSLYLLLLLSDDEIKGFKACEVTSDMRDSISSASPPVEKGHSLLSSNSKLRKVDTSKKKVDREFRSGWFKKHTNMILDSIDHVICDQSFTRNSVRVALLILGNLHTLNKQSTKNFAKRKTTYQKLHNFFDQERDSMSEDELIELEKVLKYFYTPRELYGLTKRQQQIQRLNNVYAQQIKTNEVLTPGKGKQGLIRSDSLDSLIEIINMDKMQSSTHQDENKNANRNGIQFNHSMRKTESLGPESQKYILGISQQLPHRRQISKNCVDEGQKSKFIVSSPQSQLSALSRDKLHFGKYNDSYGNYCHTLESQTKQGTPIDQTFLDNVQESAFVKERSFYLNNVDCSREELKTNSQYTSPKPTFKSKRFCHQQTIILESENAKQQTPQSNLEYDNVNLTIAKLQYKNTEMKSTQFATKISTRNKNNLDTIKSSYRTDFATTNSSCCFFYSSRTPKRKRESDRVKNSLLEGSKGSILSFAKCQHMQGGKMCEECQTYEQQRELTKEKLRDCAIF